MIKILVVEDSLPTREMIRESLKSNGLGVEIAKDGLEAIEILQGYSPDLVLLDIVMPRMNGYELCRHLKSDPKTQNIPVVMCSAKREQFDRYWGMKQGADDYIVKPFSVSELIGKIENLLNSDKDKLKSS